MFKMIKSLFQREPEQDFGALVRDGALILDVRSRGEYSSGHIDGALNIPVDQLRNHLHRLPDRKTAVITCCASGMRSSSAASILRAEGFEKVYNGGGWINLKSKL